LPRRSPYVITLSRHEREFLEGRARKYTLPYFQVVRAHMIRLAAEGHSNDDIAAALSIGRDVVSLWRKRFFYQRVAGLEEQPRSGRPRVFPPRTRRSDLRRWRVNCPPPAGAPVASEHRRDRPRGAAARHCRHRQRHHRLALVARRRHSALAASHLDLPPRSRLRNKSRRILDPYARHWDGRSLTDADFVLSADENTSIQARMRTHRSTPPRARQPMRVEHEYARGGAWAYLAALDVHRAKLFGRCERTTGIAPFDRLVTQVMAQSPYREARRVFWIVDNGSSHGGEACVRRLQTAFPNLVPVHGPIHASWLNQIEIYFSIVQRKALTPNDFSSLEEVEARLRAFQTCYESIARPFEWRFTKDNLAALMRKLDGNPAALAAVA
jgi:DDE superfamily endonuclease/Winged helix-turn helix